MKIAVLGGTFNPIHVGHIALAKSVAPMVDEVWLLTAGVSYLKINSCNLSGEQRHHMVEASLSDTGFDKIKASSLEIERSGNSYTYETVAYLQEHFPQHEFIFVYGSDCLFHIETWKNASYLFQNASFLFACRSTDDYEGIIRKKEEMFLKYHIICEILKVQLPDVSSTQIRERLRQNISIEGLVTPSVYTIIMEKGYYCEAD